MNTFLYIFFSIIITSLISLVGVFTMGMKEEKLKRILPFLVSLSVGSLLGGFFIHILPELSDEAGDDFSIISLYILGGILFFYLTEKIIH